MNSWITESIMDGYTFNFKLVNSITQTVEVMVSKDGKFAATCVSVDDLENEGRMDIIYENLIGALKIILKGVV